MAELQVRLYDDNLASPTLIDDLSTQVEDLRFSSALHGGFKSCQFFVPGTLSESWDWLSHDNVKGRHFNRITVHEDQRLIWEGRIMEIALTMDRRKLGIQVTALGYYSSLRDQVYADATPAASSDAIVKDMLTTVCPDIDSDQSNIAAITHTASLATIDLDARRYPQDVIVDILSKISSSTNQVWYFAIWDDRIPYLTVRSVSSVDWYVWLDSMSRMHLQQSGIQLRNRVYPVVGTTEGTAVNDTDSQALYPQRDLMWQLQTGLSASNEAEAATMALNERAYPRQSETFKITGPIYSTANGLVDAPKHRVRAGDVIRIQDLVPSSASTPALDDLRTFYILDAMYDVDTDTLTIQPDRPPRSLSAILPRLGQVENQ